MMRDQIIKEIQRLATLHGGKAPGSRSFSTESGIPEYAWRGKLWARWGDAIAEAGLTPNQKQEKFDIDLIFSKLAEATRYFKHIPSVMEMRMYRKIDGSFPGDKTMQRYFHDGEKNQKLRGWLEKNSGYEDVLAILPAIADDPEVRSASKVSEGFVYLIRSGPHYKIGRSEELERRVKQIRVALPDSATLEHSIRTDDPAGIEGYWHRRFAGKRANGEWFKLDRADVAAFKRRKYQ